MWLNWLFDYFNFTDDKYDPFLHTRMINLSEKWNGFCIHPFKPFVITLNSTELLKLVNSLTSYNDKMLFYKQWNEIYKNVCTKLYNKFNPSMILHFNDEINLVFYHNPYGDIWGNGNVNRLISNISSYASLCLGQQFVKNNIDIEFYINCKIVSFDDKYESLNWIIWRQSDCRKNTVALLYKCYHLDFSNNTNLKLLNEILNSKVEGIKTKNLEEFLYYNVDNVNELKNLLLGTVLKKQIRIIYNDENHAEYDDSKLYTRKEIEMFNISLKDNFLNNFRLFIKDKYLI